MNKKVLVIAHRMDLGGTEKALLSFLDALLQRRHHVKLLLLEPGGVLFTEIPTAVEVEILPFFEEISTYAFASPIAMLGASLRSRRIREFVGRSSRYIQAKWQRDWTAYYRHIVAEKVQDYHADVAVAYAGHIDFINYLLVTKVHAAKKYIWMHFDVDFIIHQTDFGKRYYPSVDRIVCVSEDVRLRFVRRFPATAGQTVVVRNSIVPDRLYTQAMQGPHFDDGFTGIRILTIGRLAPVKGQDIIPAVVAMLKQSGIDFRWYLVGGGALYESLQASIQELDIADRLILLGEHVNPYGYLAGCAIYVQTSVSEGCCISIQEAKIFNKPVVSTTVNSVGELLVDQEDGCIVRRDAESLFLAIGRLLTDERLRELYSRNLKVRDFSDDIDQLVF